MVYTHANKAALSTEKCLLHLINGQSFVKSTRASKQVAPVLLKQHLLLLLLWWHVQQLWHALAAAG
jgi:hypothetical protein